MPKRLLIVSITMTLLPTNSIPFDPSDGKSIAVMMSGGVDSSVTAHLLRREGWNVVGVTMKIPYADGCDVRRSCCGAQAAHVAGRLGIPHYFLDVRAAFEKRVIEPFREWYAQGRTPSPCVDCNTEIKFDYAWKSISAELGVDCLATGHYARVIIEGEQAYLARAVDLSRDQSYFLYGIERDRLANLRLPLGEFSKTNVREIARKARLPVASRQDSMELCFAGEDDYRNALGESARRPGSIIDERGEVIGEHTGIVNYTIGQRKGIGIAAAEPLFVSRIDPLANTITVAPRSALFQATVHARRVNVLIPDLAQPGTSLFGKIRSQGDPEPCSITAVSESALTVTFAQPTFAPTPGQRLVLYDDGGRVVAGGIIGE